MDDDLVQPPEAVLIEDLRQAFPKKERAVSRFAKLAGISEGRWRQIAKGYQQATRDTRVPVVAPADTLARMARAVGATPDQLRSTGRDDAADELERMMTVREAAQYVRDGGTLRTGGMPEGLGKNLAKLFPPEVNEPPAPAEYTISDEKAVIESGWSTATDLAAAVLGQSEPSEELLAASRRVVFDISAYLIIRILESGFAPQLESWLARIYSEREKLYRQLSTGEPNFPWAKEAFADATEAASEVVREWGHIGRGPEHAPHSATDQSNPWWEDLGRYSTAAREEDEAKEDDPIE
ncbi:hypothetical protein [Mycobacterium sp. TY814]|uniref:hypothetical protein n=1 Tax=Mycobacterium sp. TY814 TaxID=3050580 RepID=UPI002741EB8E|nr:hypothetical protein [Mycobacterium sp. TY814]MDP7721844.1 hypothetical protein [Mycobacterium sp. TY814]